VELVQVSATGKLALQALKPGRYVLGRDTRCALRVPDGQVSRQHCEFEVRDDGVSVRDLGSSNGTYVNTSRVERAQLRAGDLIAIGPLVLVVRLDGDPENIDPVLLYEQGRPRGEESERVRAEPVRRAAPPVARHSDDAPTSMSRNDDSSIIDFDFDLRDDGDDQPPL
jgi:pSer/pThr/pTyr-binding forkhead associated (FHA) protein